MAWIVLIASSAILVSTLGRFPPRLDRGLHSAIGETLAREAIRLRGPEGKITLISRDTQSFRQPALDVLLKAFQREVGRQGVPIAFTQSLQTDPLRPAEVPSGDFFEAIRRAPAGHVIVSLLGPPLLSEEQRKKLGVIKPKIVAFCSGDLANTLDLRQLFQAGLLHAAVVSRPPTPAATKGLTKGSGAFDALYKIVQTDGPATISARSPETP